MADMYGSTPAQQQAAASQPNYTGQVTPDWVNNFLYGLMKHHQTWEAKKNFGVKAPDQGGGTNGLAQGTLGELGTGAGGGLSF